MDKRALGKGLSALIPDKEREDSIAGEVVAYLKTSTIIDNRYQPRTDYDETKLQDLMKVAMKLSQEKGV